MCGICAFIGNFNGTKYAFDGIKVLQNRGYDSSGVCSISNDNEFICHKYASKKKSALEVLENDISQHEPGKIVQFHTRWSTTGGKTDENAHPHIDYTGRFSIVHNGIIENYSQIKKELMVKYNVPFKSQTDTEVIVNLISVMYDKYQKVEEAMKHAFMKLEGTWAVVLITTLKPDDLFCARHGSPLLIGFGDGFNMVASEQSGFCNYVNNYICLNDNDIIVLEKKDDQVVFNKIHDYNLRNITSGKIELTPDPYPFWTIKEINEQSDAVLRTMNYGSRIPHDSLVRLGGFNSNKKELETITNLIMLGCGTSFNAGLYSSHIFKRITDFNTIQVFDGAEFSEFDIPKKGKTAVIFISQSGETRDLIRCIDICKKHDLFMIGVINVVDSYIAREVHCGIYLNAGREVAVASTKAFTTQVVALYMVALWFAQIKNINEHQRKTIISDLRRLPLDIQQVVGLNDSNIKKIALLLQDKNSLFILGKGTTEPIAKEGSLKIKEIGYIHAESYSSSALKHGPFSLLGKDTPVIIIVPDDENILKNEAVCEEVKARDSVVVGISNTDISDKYDIKLNIPKNGTFNELLSVIPMQLIAYELALLKGTNPDQPRNLAKVITV